MKDDDKTQSFHEDLGDSDEVEILEVVGMDEDVPPPGGADRADDRRAHEPHEVVLAFDEGAEASPDRGGGRIFDDALANLSDRDQLHRLRSDYENLRRRIDREREEFELHANSSLVSRILPVLDNFERALAAAPESGPERPFRDGVHLIYKQLMDQLRKEGLRTIESVGRPFDPTLHDAVATEPSLRIPGNIVVEELQRGYIFQERLLRPAMVKVSTTSPSARPSNPGGEES
jgi:molecular chaperone GrpE